MTDDASIHYRTLRRRIRPARVATVIPARAENWEAEAMRMMENYSITWGGLANILVPSDDLGAVHPAFWPLIELFDADLWATYAHTLRGVQMTNPKGFRDWLTREARKWTREHGGGMAHAREMLSADHIVTDTNGSWRPPAALSDEICRRTAPSADLDKFHFSTYRADGPPGDRIVDVRDVEPLPRHVQMVDTHRLPTSLQLLIASRCGALAPSHLEGLVDAGVAVDVALVDDASLGLLLRLAWFGDAWRTRLNLFGALPYASPFADADFLSKTPMRLSGLGCARMSRWWVKQDESPFVVVVGSHANDFAYALALERCGIAAAWLPGDAGADEEVWELVRESLVRGIATSRLGSHERPTVLRSLSISSKALMDLAERLRSTTVWGSDLGFEVVDEVELPPYRLPVLVDPACFDDPIEEPFTGEATARAIPAALPSEVRSADSWKLTWWVEVNDPDRPLPPRHVLKDLVVAETQSWKAIARCGRDGISYFSHTMGFVPTGASISQVVERPRLRFPSASSVFQELFARAGFTARESPAGRFRRLTTELWGGLDALADDLTEPARVALLRAWLSTAKSGEDPGVFTSGRRRYLSMSDATVVSGLEPGDVRTVLDGYLARGILRRGLVLKCEHCLHFDWYDLEDLGQSFACRRCRTSSIVTQRTWRSGDEPTPYYDLAEVVFQALRGNAEVPVRALAALRGQARSFAETPEMEVTDHEGNQVEVDLLTIADGRILIGEAKTGDVIQATARAEAAWLSRLARIADAIAADEVVFATASPAWRQQTASRIHKTFEGLAPTVVKLIENC